MPTIPRDRGLDSTLALLVEGYTFISRRCERYQTDVFQTRLLLQRTICMLGAEAARVFYDTERFQRKQAAPKFIQKTLFGQGGVQGLDGEAHRCRKQMFMALMTPDSISRLADIVAEQWRAAIDIWATRRRVVLFDEVQEVLCRSVCRWAGVPLAEAEVARRTHDLGAMVHGVGVIGLAHIQARQARRRSEKWGKSLIKQIRAHRLPVAEGKALHTIAWHRDHQGKLLRPQIASVELLNVLRPTVAIARFITFAALALHEHPDQRQQLIAGNDKDLERFVQEVRRFYPFFPMAVARVRKTFEWQGYRFPQGRKVMLDLYGTNHDPRLWQQPHVFDPERFRYWDGNAFTFVPQGGGAYETGHRCPGEWITIEVMKVAVHALTMEMSYSVPPQNLRINMARMPSLPHSGFIIQNVQRVSQPTLHAVG